MLAEDIDIHEVFKVHPTAMALLTADLEFIDANDEFLAASGHELDDLLGKNVFTVFPKSADATGPDPKWTALEEAQASGRRQGMALTRYDIEDPTHPGVFLERYFSISVTPIRGLDGHVEVLEWSAREVTPVIAEFKKLQHREQAAAAVD
jgi:PAS domain-containing protein